MQLEVAAYEVWTSWCELQTSYLVVDDPEAPQYGCVEPGDITREDYPEWRCTIRTDHGLVGYSGFKCAACEATLAGLCACDETSCTANLMTAPHGFDLLELSDGYDKITGPFAPGSWIDLTKVE